MGGGRPDYYRTSSGGEEYKERGGGYFRSNSESHNWSEEGSVYYILSFTYDHIRKSTTERTGRAIQDNNWRSTQSGPWGKSWSSSSGVGVADQGKKQWQPLPEWMTDDKSSAGTPGGGENKAEENEKVCLI